MSAGLPGRLRRAGLRDLDRVVPLWLAIGEHHAALDRAFELNDAPEAEARELVRALLRDPDQAAFLYEEEGRVLGLCIVGAARARAVSRERERAEIGDLGVAPAHRRRGIGRRLVDEALAWTAQRGIERVSVRVAVANREGQAFWRALGFGDLVDVLCRRL